MSSQISLCLSNLLTQPKVKWTIFTKWCLNIQVKFREPPVKSIANFQLLQNRKLQPNIIDNYMSAIDDKSRNWSINVSNSFHRDRPKEWKGIPSWNLFLVLHQLTKSLFEPIKEVFLKQLTFKTVFLLALGLDKCRSEIMLGKQEYQTSVRLVKSFLLALTQLFFQ